MQLHLHSKCDISSFTATQMKMGVVGPKELAHVGTINHKYIKTYKNNQGQTSKKYTCLKKMNFNMLQLWCVSCTLRITMNYNIL